MGFVKGSEMVVVVVSADLKEGDEEEEEEGKTAIGKEEETNLPSFS